MSDWEKCVGPGWRPLVRPLVAYAEKYGFVIAQVKEKFGGLRFYYRSPKEISPEVQTFFRSAVDGASQLSLLVCEVCGEPGESRDGSWILTLCDACQAARLERKNS